jgi:hypothetical protein
MLSAHDQQMAQFHGVLLTLLADARAYRKFVESPNGFAASIPGLSRELANAIVGLNLAGLKTFRQIVRGTREERLFQIFSGLTERFGTPEAWRAMIERFLDDVVIRNGRTDEDLDQFVEWLRENERECIFDCAALELAVYTVSNQPPVRSTGSSLRSSNRRLKVRYGCRAMRLRWPIDQLLSAEFDEIENQPQETRLVVLYLPEDTDELKIVEIPELLAQSLDIYGTVNSSLITDDHVDALAQVGASLEEFLDECEAE